MDQYVLIRFSKDVLRLFDPWSNFEHVQKLSRISTDIQVLLRMTTDTIWKATDQFGLPRTVNFMYIAILPKLGNSSV